jgi:SAM-dependent methyltransferase
MADAMASAGNLHAWVFSKFADAILADSVTLEVGAGHAKYTRLLAGLSRRVIATDIDAAAVAGIRDATAGTDNVCVLAMDGVDAGRLEGLVDNIVALNVVEHIEDDAGFLRDCCNAMRKGGRVVVVCPAFPSLFSEIDREAGHYRRYRKSDLAALVEKSGFTVLRARYFNVAGFLGWLVNKALRSGVNSRSTNMQVAVYDKCLWFLKLFEVFTPLVGLSVLVIGEKK